jgi:hypothetical protein
LARLGYATKGVVYGLVGILAVMLAAGAGGSTEDSRGVIQTIAAQPFGKFLVGAMALGLLGYALWRVVQAWKDTEHQGNDTKGIIARLGFAISGIVYVSLAFMAARIAIGSGSGGGGNSQQAMTATLLSQPFGQWLVGLVGVIVIVVGLYHFYQAYQAKFMKEYQSGQMSPRQRRGAKRIGQFGLSARGVTFCMIGGFLVSAAVNANPSEAKGLSGAFDTLARQPYGPWLLGLVALGFVAYGVYCLSRAWYRRFSTT